MSGDVVARASRLAGGIDSGQWDVVREQGEFYGVYKGEFGRRVAGLIYDRREAEFIAAARSLVPELVDEIERKSAQLAEWIAQYRDREAGVATLEIERDQWKALWQENTQQASAAMRERDAANAEVEKLRGAMKSIRDKSSSAVANPVAAQHNGYGYWLPLRDILAVIAGVES